MKRSPTGPDVTCHAHVESKSNDKKEQAPGIHFPAETVIIAMGPRSDPALADELAGGPDVYAIGDCVEPREAMDAVWEGFEVGRTV